MRIFFKTQYGHSFSLEIDPSSTIAALKAQIKESQGFPIEQQRLTFNNSTLEEGVFDSFNIQADSTILLLLRQSCEEGSCLKCQQAFDHGERFPRVLNCMHGFCRACVGQLSQATATIRCPVCGHETQLTDKSPDRLLAGFHLLEAADMWRLKTGGVCPCEACEEGAGHWCLTCSKALCDYCAGFHRRQKVTRTHDVQALADVRKKGDFVRAARSIVYCDIHSTATTPLEMSLVCTTCKPLQPVCQTCAITTHKNHEFVLPAKVVVERTDILSALEALGTRTGKLEAAVAEFQVAAQQVRKRGEELEAEVKTATQQLLQAVRDRESAVLKELGDQTHTQLKLLDEQRESIQRLIDDQKQTGVFALQAVRSPDLQLLLTKPVLIQHLSRLQARSPSLSPPLITTEINTTETVVAVKSALSGLGVSVPVPAKCSVDVQLARDSIEVNVVLRDRAGAPVNGTPEINLRYEDEKAALPMKLKTTSPGYVNCCCPMPRPGMVLIEALVCGQHISGSPLKRQYQFQEWNAEGHKHPQFITTTTFKPALGGGIGVRAKHGLGGTDVAYWEIAVEKATGGSGEIVGVAARDAIIDGFGCNLKVLEGDVWGYHIGGVVGDRSGKTSVSGARKVGLLLDMGARTLTFWLDGKKCHVQLKGLPAGPLFPIIYECCAGASFLADFQAKRPDI